jgi:hypothetical protein
MLLGIFLLFAKALYDDMSNGYLICLRRSDFYPVDSRNIVIILAF